MRKSTKAFVIMSAFLFSYLFPMSTEAAPAPTPTTVYVQPAEGGVSVHLFATNNRREVITYDRRYTNADGVALINVPPGRDYKMVAFSGFRCAFLEYVSGTPEATYVLALKECKG